MAALVVLLYTAHTELLRIAARAAAILALVAIAVLPQRALADAPAQVVSAARGCRVAFA